MIGIEIQVALMIVLYTLIHLWRRSMIKEGKFLIHNREELLKAKENGVINTNWPNWPAHGNDPAKVGRLKIRVANTYYVLVIVLCVSVLLIMIYTK